MFEQSVSECRERDSNPHSDCSERDFKSVSTGERYGATSIYSATRVHPGSVQYAGKAQQLAQQSAAGVGAGLSHVSHPLDAAYDLAIAGLLYCSAIIIFLAVAAGFALAGVP